MSAPDQEFYSAERWNNWIDRIREEDIDAEEENSARLLLNLQDDTAIAIAKVLTAYEEDDIDEEAALTELNDIRDIVLSEVDLEDEEKELLIDGVQTSLTCCLVSADEFIRAGTPDDAESIDEYVKAAAVAEAEGDLETAMSYCATAGTLLIEGGSLDMSLTENMEYGLVIEWVNGLDSLQNALRDPEVVEE